MPQFRIHRMKDNPRQQFRWAPHVSGVANVKPKDYELADEVEAGNEYAAWAVLRNSERPLQVGDLLEMHEGQLRICKYVGFEEARWVVPEGTPNAESASVANGFAIGNAAMNPVQLDQPPLDQPPLDQPRVQA